LISVFFQVFARWHLGPVLWNLSTVFPYLPDVIIEIITISSAGLKPRSVLQKNTDEVIMQHLIIAYKTDYPMDLASISCHELTSKSMALDAL